MKKYWKGILATTLILSMTAALAGCSSSTDSTTDTTTDGTESTEGTDATTDGTEADATGDKTLIMATSADFPPYEYYEGQTVVGIDAEIAQALADKLGYTLQIEDMNFDSIIPAITSGKADIAMAGLTATEDRKESIDFSDSYATGVQVVIVKDGSPIQSVDDLLADGANYTVGVQTSTTGDIYATTDIEQAGKGTVERYTKGTDAVAALQTGKIDCVIIDSEPAKSFVAANEGLSILDTEYTVEDYAIGLAKDSPLTAEINTALQELIADGTVQSIVDKYITAE